MATVHKKYGGSAIERTMLCHGSVKAIAELPVRQTNEAAERGTRIHAWFERYLKGDSSVKAKTAQDKKEAMIAVKAGEKVKELLAQFGLTMDDCKQEQSMVLHPDYPIAGGSPDLFGFRPFRDFVMLDLKAGHNQVEAKENHQLLLYTCAALNSLDPFVRHTLNDCHMIIVQPNEDGSEVNVRIWTLPVADLDAYEALYKSHIDYAEANPDARVPGEHCTKKYCDARTTCPQFLNWVASTSNEETAKIFAAAAAEPDRAARLKVLLDNAKTIIDLIDQAKKDAASELSINPDAIGGWYLKTDVKGDREWESWKKAEKALKDLGFKIDEIAPRKEVSVAQAEKLCKDKKIEFTPLVELITRPDAKPQLKKGERPNDFAAFAPSAEASPAPASPTAPPAAEAPTPALMPVSGGVDPNACAATAGA